MSAIKQKLVAEMKLAMRAKNTIMLDAIRMMRAAVQRQELEQRAELDDAGVVQVIQKMVKQCNHAARQFVDGGRQDLADKELADIAVMEAYLPAKMTTHEVDAVIAAAIQQTGAESIKDMGKVMAMVKHKVQGRADMGAVSGRIKALLAS